MKNTILDRFNKYVMPEPNTGCWIWVGCVSSDGYGNIWMNGSSKAHRVSYELFKGSIGKGIYICHNCDNRLCVNPDHLYAGDAQTNCNDRVLRGRSASGFNKKKDITACRYGRLTVLSFAGLNNNRQAKWRCVCDCGKEKIILATTLIQGLTVSCGCYGTEARRNWYKNRQKLKL